MSIYKFIDFVVVIVVDNAAVVVITIFLN